MDLSKIRLLWPVDPEIYKVTQGFGENPGIYARFGLAGHNGIDFGVPQCTEVKAAAPGMVMKVGTDPNGYGNYVKIDHGGYQTLYGHLRNWTVKLNDLVDVGDVIGLSGNTGFSTGPHLHFELRVPGYGAPGYASGARDASPFMVAVEPLPYPSPFSQNENGEGEIIAGAVCLVTATGGLNLREGKSTSTPSLAIVMYNTTVTASVVDVDGDWAEVTITGFLNKKYLQVK